MKTQKYFLSILSLCIILTFLLPGCQLAKKDEHISNATFIGMFIIDYGMKSPLIP